MLKNALHKSLSTAIAVLLLAGFIPFLAFAQDINTTHEVLGCTVEGCCEQGCTAESCASADCAGEDCTGDCTGDCVVEGYAAGEYAPAAAQSDSAEILFAAAEDTEVTEDKDESEEGMYVVTFYDWDRATILGSFEVKAGDVSPTPMPPSREGHIFVKWDMDVTDVTDDLTVHAVYREMKTFTVAIQYVFTNGDTAEQSYGASVEEGAPFTQDIASPAMAGFTPNLPSTHIALASVTQDVWYTVTYSPSSGTPYKVIHHFERLDLSGYENPLVEVFYGANGQTVVAQANHYPGFSALSDEQRGVVSSNGSLELNIYYVRNTVALYFDSRGGSYLEPLAGRYGQPVTYPSTADPLREGFDFVSWDKTLPVTFPEADMTFVARWNEHAEAAVTVIHWIEDARSGDYRIASVDTSQIFATGSKPDFTGFYPSYASGEGYIGFPLNNGVTTPDLFNKYYPRNAAQTYAANKDVVVKSDGSTSYNIYYDLATITYTFLFPGKSGGAWAGWQYNSADVSLNIGGREYLNGEYRIIAKYSADLSTAWPRVQQLAYAGSTVEDLNPYNWNIGDSAYAYDVTITVGEMSARSLELGGINNAGELFLKLTVYPPGTQMTTITIEHYYQDFSGGTDTSEDYELVRSYKATRASGTYVTVVPDTGFVSVRANGPEIVESNNTLYLKYIDGAVYQIYHDRGRYSVVFNSKGATVERIDGLWYQDALAEYPGHLFEPDAPAANSDYDFAGWYSSPYFEDSAKVDLKTLKMPARELMLYARWVAPSYQVIFDLAGGSGTDAPQYILSGGYVAPYDEPVKPGHLFAGWKERGKNVVFSFNNRVVRSLDLVATWIPEQSGSYTVFFREQETNRSLASPLAFRGIAVGSSQTATAKVISGYIPDSVTKSVTITGRGTELIFSYRPFVSGTYQVRYETVEGQQLLLPATRTTYHSYVTENHVPIPGYYPVSAQLPLQISQDLRQNVIVFKYLAYNHALYTVNHYQQGLDWSYRLVATYQLTAEIDRYITVAPRSYEEFSYNRTISNPSGKVDVDGSLVLSLYYDLSTYAVAFRATDGGSLLGVTEYPNILSGTSFGTAVRIPTPEPDDGYRFAGWAPSLPGSSSLVTADATYVARFESTGNADTVPSETIPPVTAVFPTMPPSITPPAATTPESGEEGAEDSQQSFLDVLNRLLSDDVPLAAFDGSHWSLFNLIASLVCCIAALVLLIRSFGTLKRDARSDARRSSEAVAGDTRLDSEAAGKTHAKRRYNILRSLAIIVGLAPLILFIILEDMAESVALFNEYTPFFALLAAAFVALILIQSRARKLFL
ncbi:MAG: InlB B-repeat-containing protein [Coriobacteriales bacterium]|jgi:hypothetical protein|nr:InlB B-repeat-containing protein [Coriobacteriales bacterium]